ncbi:MAG TPA: HEAT repeat domain-containing protein [Myxococcota bacterium]
MSILLGAAGARAHVIFGTETLRGLVQQSDLVARVRILSPGTALPLEEPVVVAEVLELIKGPAAEGPLRFVQHGHGVPLYQKDQEVAVFLQRISRSRELGSLAGKVDWVSIQEGDALPGSANLAAALSAYAALEKLPPTQRAQEQRQLTLKLLSSPDSKLASSAVRDVAFAGDALVLTNADLPTLEAVLWNSATPIGVRVGLLTELERRKLLPGPPQWVRLLRETHGADQLAVARALAAHPSAPVTQELVALLASPDVLLVSTAAISLGVPGNGPAVEPLGKLLASKEERVRMAAIRGLGRIGTPAAQAQLAKAAASHPDPDTRRRAGAEVARQP